MFREIRRTERIVEKSEKQKRLDYLHFQLFDSLIGGERFNRIKKEIEELEKMSDDQFVTQMQTFDPDKRVVIEF